MAKAWSVWGKGLVVGVLVLVLLGGWWFLLSENRKLASEVGTLTRQMTAVKKHVDESRQLYDALNTIKQEIRNARVETDRALDASCGYAGTERMDYLMQLLEADLQRRSGDSAAGVSPGGVPKPGRAGSASPAR